MAQTITAARAVSIARDWHGGGNTALATFATTKRLDDGDLPRALREVEAELDSDGLTAAQELELCKLRRWLRAEADVRGLR